MAAAETPAPQSAAPTPPMLDIPSSTFVPNPMHHSHSPITATPEDTARGQGEGYLPADVAAALSRSPAVAPGVPAGVVRDLIATVEPIKRVLDRRYDARSHFKDPLGSPEHMALLSSESTISEDREAGLSVGELTALCDIARKLGDAALAPDAQAGVVGRGELDRMARVSEYLRTHWPEGIVRGNLYAAVKMEGEGTGWRYMPIDWMVDDIDNFAARLAATPPPARSDRPEAEGQGRKTTEEIAEIYARVSDPQGLLYHVAHAREDDALAAAAPTNAGRVAPDHGQGAAVAVPSAEAMWVEYEDLRNALESAEDYLGRDIQRCRTIEQIEKLDTSSTTKARVSLDAFVCAILTRLASGGQDAATEPLPSQADARAAPPTHDTGAPSHD